MNPLPVTGAAEEFSSRLVRLLARSSSAGIGKKRTSSRFKGVLSFTLLLLTTGPLAAGQFGDFTYTDNGASITITDYPTNAVGAVVIPATIGGKPVTSIDALAFAGCTGITSVAIPASVTSIGGVWNASEGLRGSAFPGCTMLTSFSVDAANGSYTTEDGVLFNKTKTSIVQFPAGKGPSYAIPASVIGIGDGAFGGCSNLTNVIIPPSVTQTGQYAFSGCGLQSLTISGGIGIGFEAFGSCYPTSMTIAGPVSFSSIKSSFPSVTVINIANGVTEIVNGAFAWCDQLASVTIPASVTRIGDNAFRGCTGISSILLPAGVTAIGSSAFQDCNGLTAIAIPSSVTQIGIHAFRLCRNLTSVTISNGLSGIPMEAFAECSELTSVTIPPSVSTVGAYAFFNCGLTSLSIPEGVTTIEAGAFWGCWSLQSLSLPESLVSIGSESFYGCFQLKDVTIPSGNIGNSAFFDCWQMTRLTLGNGVGGIGDSAFRQCVNLTEVTFPESVGVIGANAFRDSGVTMAVFKGNAPSMGESVFNAAYGALTVLYNGGASGFSTPTWNGYSAYPATPPSFTGAPPPAARLGTYYLYQLGAVGQPPPSYSVTSGTLPPGLTISSDGRISGSPTAAGVFTGTITASNGFAPDATQAFSIDTHPYQTLTAGGTHGTVGGGGTYLQNSTVSVTAIADPGYLFTGWTGAYTGPENPVGILMDSNKTITATFSPDTNDDDDDGLTNFQEIVQLRSNPNLSDTDGDNVGDKEDAFPVNPAEALDTDKDGIGDNADTDDDGDLLPDADEVSIHGTNPKRADSDGDRLSDKEELEVHLTNPLDPDWDHDGLADGEEVLTALTNPKVPDTDADGFLDGYEVLTGKLPLDPLSKPALVAEARTAIEFTFPSALGKVYRIESSTDLATWTLVESGIAGNGGEIQRFYSIRNQPKRYFRVEDEAP